MGQKEKRHECHAPQRTAHADVSGIAAARCRAELLHQDRAGCMLRAIGESVMLRRGPRCGMRLSLSEAGDPASRIGMAMLERQTQHIWADFGDRLRVFVARRVENEADAEDILQDVFLRIHTHLDTLADERKLTSWVYQITRNAIVDHYRRRRPTAALPDELVVPQAPSDDVLKELLPCLDPMLERLPAADRTALFLTEMEGLTQQELANRLGLSLSGAKSRVQRARQKLKSAFGDCCQIEADRRGRFVEYHTGCDGCRWDHCNCAGAG